jgi:hypothetical protein
MARGSNNGADPRRHTETRRADLTLAKLELAHERDTALQLVSALWHEDYTAYLHHDQKLAAALRSRELPDDVVMVVGGLLIHEAQERFARRVQVSVRRFRRRLTETQRRAITVLPNPPFFK